MAIFTVKVRALRCLLALAGILVLSVPAIAYARSCIRHARFNLVEPDVVILEGDVDPIREEQRWDALEGQLLGPRDVLGPHELAVGQEMFLLEKLP